MAEVGIFFPELTPSSRRYTPGKRPETIFESQNGATTFVQFGNQQVNAELQLEFRNITDDEATSIIQHYDQITENNWVKFSAANGLGGMSTGLVTIIPKGNDSKVLRWRYQGPPEITSVFPGISSVSCSFIGFFYGA